MQNIYNLWNIWLFCTKAINFQDAFRTLPFLAPWFVFAVQAVEKPWLNKTSPIYVNRTLICLSLVWHLPLEHLTFKSIGKQWLLLPNQLDRLYNIHGFDIIAYRSLSSWISFFSILRFYSAHPKNGWHLQKGQFEYLCFIILSESLYAAKWRWYWPYCQWPEMTFLARNRFISTQFRLRRFRFDLCAILWPN